MSKLFATKRDFVRAVQWRGEMTPEIQELFGSSLPHVDAATNRLTFASRGFGRAADVGDWLLSASGEDVSLIGDDDFRRLYEEVDETGRGVPSDAEHDAARDRFFRELDAILIAGLRLTREDHPSIFRDRDKLLRELRGLFEDHAWVAARRERQKIAEKITKEILP